MESIDNSHVILGTIAAIVGIFLRPYLPWLPSPTPAPLQAPTPTPTPASNEARLDAIERQLAALIAALSRPAATPTPLNV